MANDLGSLIGIVVSALIVWWSYETLKVTARKGASTVLYWAVIIVCACSALSNFVAIVQNAQQPTTRVVVVEKVEKKSS
jgi:hypothetical protein